MKSIMEFAKEGQSTFWFDPVFHFFPELDKEKYVLLTNMEREKYLTEYFLSEEYRGVIKTHMVREQDKHHMIYFVEDGMRVMVKQEL